MQEIKRLQSRGLTLAEIARTQAQVHPKSNLPQPEAWWRYPIDSDVVVLVKASLSPWRLRRVQKSLNQLANELQIESVEEEGT